MNTNTIAGALIATAIALITGYLAIMALPEINSWHDISEKAWTVLFGGATINFLKDYYAITVRRGINVVTGSGDGGGSGPLVKREKEDPNN